MAQNPIAYNPIFAKISGKVTHALFLSQILYWRGKGADPEWFYKSIKELRDETGLSRAQQDSAKKYWENMGVIEVKLAKVPARRHFRVDEDVLLAIIVKYFQEM